MWSHLFLVLLLAVTGSVDHSGLVDPSGSETVKVFVGETAVLPCTYVSHDQLTVEWFKEDKVALVYRDGCEIHAEKDEAYEFRTSLFMNDLKYGNISLRIGNVQLSDGGMYTCRTIMNGVQMDHIVELVVSVPVSEPRLLAVHTKDGGVTVQCESGCLFSKPKMNLLDDHGNTLTGEDLNPEDSSNGCVSMTRRVRVESSVRRVTCRIELPDRDQPQVAEMYLPDGGAASCTVATSFAAVEGVILLGLIIYLVWVRMQLSSRQKKQGISSDQRAIEDPRNQDVGILIDDEHLGAMEDLKQRLLTKEEEIQQLTQQLDDLKSRLNHHSPEPVSSRLSRDRAQTPQPTTRSRISSCPDFLDDNDPLPPSPPPLIPTPPFPLPSNPATSISAASTPPPSNSATSISAASLPPPSNSATSISANSIPPLSNPAASIPPLSNPAASIPPLSNPAASIPPLSNPAASIWRTQSLSLSQPSQRARPKRRYTTSGMSALAEDDREQLLHPGKSDPLL
ncbi:butyrophilin subfamily 1 member A1-like [Halichoeres trimaculatus]|uniref:butyrophilin subfamily 1 member A1-like n=1 Tax=Halichoeres trimaculatus TaxID=147232 RepID=UPI003D9F2231